MRNTSPSSAEAQRDVFTMTPEKGRKAKQLVIAAEFFIAISLSSIF
jgi:hypothetical protein